MGQALSFLVHARHIVVFLGPGMEATGGVSNSLLNIALLAARIVQ
jgi:hypothetical protein